MIDSSQVHYLDLDKVFVLLNINIKYTFIIHDQMP